MKANTKANKSDAKKSEKTEKKPFQIDSKKSAVLDKYVDDRGREWPMLNFEPTKDRYATKLGLGKIRVVLEHLSQCKKFVESNGTKC
jgi:hypothetical protein